MLATPNTRSAGGGNRYAYVNTTQEADELRPNYLDPLYAQD
ncbi:MAG: hypothetical protein V2A58_18030 [Planctomycetota bacterium]